MNWALTLVIVLAAGGIGGTIIFLIAKYVDKAAEAASLKAELAAIKKVLSNEQKSVDVLAEHRDDDDTLKRLSDRSF